MIPAISIIPVQPILAASSDAATGVGIPLALAAGLVSFLSPCVLPLVPGYLSTVIGVTPADLQTAGTRRVLVPSLLFIASFSLIFILLGMSATVIGSTLNTHKQALEQVGGALIVAMGLVFLATPFVRLLTASGIPSHCSASPGAVARSSRALPLRSPGHPAPASRSGRSSPRPRSRAPPPTGPCCWPSTPRGLRSRSS